MSETKTIKPIAGVDLSYCQAGIDYDNLKKVANFAIIRAGHGLKVDNLYSVHTRECYNRQIKIGYYWFCESNTVDGVRAEAAKFIETIGTFKDYQEYPVFFDLESTDLVKNMTKAQVSQLAITFCEYMIQNGYYAGIYTNPDWLQHYYDDKVLVGKYDIWLAHWTHNANIPSKYDYKQTIHQWGTISIPQKLGGYMSCDADNCYIDYPTHIANWRKKNNRNAEPVFNVNSAVNIFGVPLFANANDTVAIKHIMPDSTEYIIKSGPENNGRYLIANKNNGNETYWVNGNCLKVKGTTAKVNFTEAQLEKVANDVIKGIYGSGETRKQLLIKYGYEPDEIQKRVNKILARKFI